MMTGADMNIGDLANYGELAQTNFDSVGLMLAAPGMQEWWRTNSFWWESECKKAVLRWLDALANAI
jgi:hypothetical protein